MGVSLSKKKGDEKKEKRQLGYVIECRTKFSRLKLDEVYDGQ